MFRYAYFANLVSEKEFPIDTNHIFGSRTRSNPWKKVQIPEIPQCEWKNHGKSTFLKLRAKNALLG